MPKICLVGLNSAWYQSNLALYYLREALRGTGYRCVLREFTLSDLPADVLAALVAETPAVLCFSAYIWNRRQLQTLIPEIRKLLPETRVAVGGPDAGNASLNLDGVDFVISGPGEGSLRTLALAGFSLPGGEIPGTSPRLRDLPFPYRSSDLPRLKDKLVYYETSRGCPFRCAYCLSATDERLEFRFDPANPSDRRRLFSELDRLLALQPRTIKFVDRSFNANRPLARLIWERVAKFTVSCEFHFEIYPELLEAEDIRLLSQAPPGRIRFEAGIQTVNARVSLATGRSANWQKARAMLRALREETAVCLHTDLLAGLPGEGLNSVLRSLDELAALRPHEIQLGQLKILPGTPMKEIARERGYLWMDEAPGQVLRSDRLSFRQITLLYDLARILNLYWNKGEFTAAWEELLGAGEPCSHICLRIRDFHLREGMPFHSISRQTRAEVFAAAISGR